VDGAKRAYRRVVDGQKTCADCGWQGPEESFPLEQGRTLGARSSYCPDCRKRRTNEAVRTLQANRLQAGLCVDCSGPGREGRLRCLACQRRQTALPIARRRALKQRAVDYLGGCCLDCGLRTALIPVYAFHHRDPKAKDATAVRLISRGRWEPLRAELDKCDLLCANCHAVRHAVLDGWDTAAGDAALSRI
jgi:hypothetical protein